MLIYTAHRIALTLPILLMYVAAATAQQRTWTDSTGKFSVEAELVEVKDGKAVLKKTSGKLTTVPVARLSETDQRYLQSLDQPAPGPSSREYPSFPDAVTKPPTWNDANVPFDLAAFLQAPPGRDSGRSSRQGPTARHAMPRRAQTLAA
jgi:hypothetical protein